MCFVFFSLGGIVLETCRDWSMVDYARGSYEPKTLPTSPLINLNLAEDVTEGGGVRKSVKKLFLPNFDRRAIKPLGKLFKKKTDIFLEMYTPP